MTDSLEFKIINPIGKEEWADDYKIDKVVEIYINGKELIEILKLIETPYSLKEGNMELAGAYGHITHGELYKSLTIDDEDVELLCCSDCGDSGCWSILIDIEDGDNYIFWKNFKHNHRDWKYDICYKFDKIEYVNSLKQLKGDYR